MFKRRLLQWSTFIPIFPYGCCCVRGHNVEWKHKDTSSAKSVMERHPYCLLWVLLCGWWRCQFQATQTSSAKSAVVCHPYCLLWVLLCGQWLCRVDARTSSSIRSKTSPHTLSLRPPLVACCAVDTERHQLRDPRGPGVSPALPAAPAVRLPHTAA
jgi:uncharacterized membrane protein YccF (DUF307 family)